MRAERLATALGCARAALRVERRLNAAVVAQLDSACVQASYYRAIFQALDRRFDCTHADHGPAHCWQHVLHVDQLLARLAKLAPRRKMLKR